VIRHGKLPAVGQIDGDDVARADARRHESPRHALYALAVLGIREAQRRIE